MTGLFAAISGFCIAQAVILMEPDRPLWRRILIALLWGVGIVCAIHAFGRAP